MTTTAAMVKVTATARAVKREESQRESERKKKGFRVLQVIDRSVSVLGENRHRPVSRFSRILETEVLFFFLLLLIIK